MIKRGVEIRKKPINQVKNILLVASGKGGVGKSSIAVSVAILLGQNYKVGLVDGDIYGPSIAFMLGQESKVAMDKNNMFIPHKKFGISFISMGSMIDKNAPIVWRGPMLNKILKTFLLGTNWGQLDYLIVDTPPGTGDVHIALCTEYKIDASLLVTTAQKVAMRDVKKAFYMFKKLDVSVLGVVENMSYQIRDSAQSYILGKAENTTNFAEEIDTEIITRIPFSAQISESFDHSVPAVVDLNIATFYNKVIDKIVQKCSNN